MEIRAYEAGDAARLCQIGNQISGSSLLTAAQFHANLADYANVWVGVIADEAIGYTAVSTVPGLTHVRVLHGFIAPSWRRQGLGSQLLQHLLEDLSEESGDWGMEKKVQLSYCTDDTESAVYHFLRHHHFFIEHKEHHLVLPSPPHPLAPPLPGGCRLQTLPRSHAITRFIHLYDQSFGPHPWYQPYSAEEVAATLHQAQDLLFLYHENEPIGFVWMRMMEKRGAEIEPVGILEPWQGRGYGRFLLQTTVHHLAARGANYIHIGAWAENKPALHLYRSLGFQPDYTLIYLAYNL